MPEYNFSANVRSALEVAHAAAFRLGHQFVDTEHLLIGVLDTAPVRVRRILHGADHTVIVTELENRVGTSSSSTRGLAFPLATASQRVLSNTMAECRNLDHGSVEFGRLVLGLMIEKEGVAAQVLRGAGGDLDAVRAEVARQPE